MGLIRAARLAGMYPAMAPATTRSNVAIMATFKSTVGFLKSVSPFPLFVAADAAYCCSTKKFDIDLWKEIISALKKNRMRSFMTAFGVFWGIFMLILMSGAGKALENGVMDGIKAFASNSAFFLVGTHQQAL